MAVTDDFFGMALLSDAGFGWGDPDDWGEPIPPGGLPPGAVVVGPGSGGVAPQPPGTGTPEVPDPAPPSGYPVPDPNNPGGPGIPGTFDPTSPQPHNPNSPPGPNQPIGGFNFPAIPSEYTINQNNIPADLAGLRAQISSLLQQRLGQGPQPYGGNLNNMIMPEMQTAYNTAQGGLIAGNDNLNQGVNALANAQAHAAGGPGANALGGLAGQTGIDPALRATLMSLVGGGIDPTTRSTLTQLSGQGLDPTASGTLTSLAQTGGAPDITTALEAIRTRGMMDIEDMIARTKEQYGSAGLARGSDVAGYIARGASRGIADINANQSALVAQVLNEAANRRLGAGTQLGGLNLQAGAQRGNAAGALESLLQGRAGLSGQIGGMLSSADLQSLATQGQIGAATNQFNLGSFAERGNQLAQIASQFANIGQIRGNLGVAAGGVMTQNAGMQQDILGQNLQRQYADFLRMQSDPNLEAAIAYATGFPPNKPVIPEQGGNSWAAPAIGAAGSVMASILPFLMLSDRNAKYDIEPVDASDVLRATASLPIARWKYKGDTTPHIGPMAQDFQAAYGVGDGKTLNLVDVVGVLLASQKAIAERYVGRGKSAGAR